MRKLLDSDLFKIIVLGLLTAAIVLIVVMNSSIFLDQVPGLGNESHAEEKNEDLREGEDSASIETTSEGEAITLNPDFEVKVPSRYMGKDFDPFEYAKQNADTEAISPRSTEAIVRDVHHMTHGAIVARDKWGYLTLNDENIFILLTELAAVVRRNHVEERMVDMLSNWYHGDVGAIARDHNFLWDWQGGTIGKANGMDWDSVEEDIVQRAIQNRFKQ